MFTLDSLFKLTATLRFLKIIIATSVLQAHISKFNKKLRMILDTLKRTINLQTYNNVLKSISLIESIDRLKMVPTLM